MYECTSATPDGGPLDTTYPGEYVLRMSAIDRAGNLTQREVSYRVVEPALPTVGLSMPEPDGLDGWYRTRPLFALEALEGNTEVASVHWRYSIDGGEPTEVRREGPRAAFSPPLDGTYELTYWAVTRDGRAGVPETVTFGVDTTPPNVEVRAPRGPEVAALALASGQYRQGEQLIADYACDDATSGIVDCRGTVPSGAPVPTDTVGLREFVVEATDAAGNERRIVVAYEIVPAPAPGEDPPGEDPQGEDPPGDPGADPGRDPGQDPGTDPAADPGAQPAPAAPSADRRPAAGDTSRPAGLASTGLEVPWGLAGAGMALLLGGVLLIRRRVR
ncbi:hypothetical protein [Microbacterium album]|uniref:Gram-positive cocci surface proteins LPxTG domain-containing protein n=1 Tax=Microbacterium album TaxID=2053191 RepID=A0A917ICE4_9MICO|nr:hypothetical protein [Microbacterium album]GGH38149.1 hypothetical protein GCM10010921_08540 [Microbacterium album]